MRMSRSRRSLFVVSAMLAVLVLAGCAPGTLGGDDEGGGDDDRGDVVRPDAGPAGTAGEPCDRASQCAGDLVCDPDRRECSEAVACSEHVDCGEGAHCGDGGQCAKSGDTSPCDGDANCANGDSCIGGFCGCQGEVFEAELVDVNMLILLDRSGSMIRAVDSSTELDENDPNSRWQVALGAIDSLLDVYDDQINFGLGVYPHAGFPSEFPQQGDGCNNADTNQCLPGNVLVDVVAQAGQAIVSALSGTSPDGCTPSGVSLEAVAAAASLNDLDAANYILYITDGEENCGSNQVAAVQNLRQLEPEIRTFVVGFTEEVGFDELNATADAAGTARDVPDGQPRYYQALDAASLEESLQTIAGEALGCNYDLGGVPTEPENLHVYADGVSLDRDPSRQNGWDYDADANRITFFGDSCDQLRTGGVEELAIVQTCDLVVD